MGQSHPLSGPQCLHLGDGLIGVAQWIGILEPGPGDVDSLGSGPNILGSDVKSLQTAQMVLKPRRVLELQQQGAGLTTGRGDFAPSKVRGAPVHSEQNKPKGGLTSSTPAIPCRIWFLFPGQFKSPSLLKLSPPFGPRVCLFSFHLLSHPLYTGYLPRVEQDSVSSSTCCLFGWLSWRA